MNMTEKVRSQNYEVHISAEPSAPQWDAFLSDAPAGHHVQSSLWSRLKQMHNWRPLRITFSQNDEICFGVQILIKRISIFGSVGYITQGPVFASPDADQFQQIISAVSQAMKQENIQVMFLMPPRNGAAIEPLLVKAGYASQTISMGPGATTLIDLDHSLEDIQKNMKSKTRYNIRYAERHGVTVREGTFDDLPLFQELLQKTADRNEFSPESLSYFQRMHELFAPPGHFQLLFAEHEGQTISSILLVAFGDTVIYKRGGWSGEKGNLRPNEALHWHAIRWAKEQGYHFYDFEGISRDAAQARLQGEDIPEEAMNTYTRFKLGFKGDVLVLPDTYLFSRNPLINWVARRRALINKMQRVITYVQRR